MSILKPLQQLHSRSQRPLAIDLILTALTIIVPVFIFSRLVQEPRHTSNQLLAELLCGFHVVQDALCSSSVFLAILITYQSAYVRKSTGVQQVLSRRPAVSVRFIVLSCAAPDPLI